MTIEELKTRHDEISTRVCDRLGAFLYFLIIDVINISKLEKICEDAGYRTERKTFARSKYTIYSEVYNDDKLIASISGNVGWPTIEFYKGNKIKNKIKKIAENDIFLKPIKGWHRVLDWHKVEGKLHILANENKSIVLHSLSDSLSDETVNDFLIKNKLTPEIVEEIKGKSLETETKLQNKFNK